MLLGEIVVIVGCVLGAVALTIWTAPHWMRAAGAAWRALTEQVEQAEQALDPKEDKVQ